MQIYLNFKDVMLLLLPDTATHSSTIYTLVPMEQWSYVSVLWLKVMLILYLQRRHWY